MRASSIRSPSSRLPSAGVGALIVLMMFKMDLSIIAMIGIVMLVGIVKKNAIMMIDFAIQRRAVSLSAGRGDPRGCLFALPADHDDDVAAIFGALPIALGAGAGSELRQPLGIAWSRLAGVAAADALHHPGRLLYLDSRAPAQAGRSPADLHDEHKRRCARVAAE